MHLFRRISLTGLTLLALPLCAQYMSDRAGSLDYKAKLDWDLRPVPTMVGLAAVRGQLPAAQQNGWSAFQRANGNWQVLLDRRTSLPANAIGQGIPTIPGRGNSLSMRAVMTRLAGLGNEPAIQSESGASVDPNGIRLGHMDLLSRDFIRTNATLFPGVDANSLVLNTVRSGNYGDNGYLWYVDYDQVVNGYRVDGARLSLRYNHGNLVQFGTDNWSRVRPDATTALVTADQALATAKEYLGWDERRDTLVRPVDIKLTVAAGFEGDLENDRDEPGKDYRGRVGMGRYTHKLVYDVTLRRAGYAGTWLLRVSAKDGSVLEARDINDYGTIKGGVYPGTASGKGTEINIPMPFANYGSGLYSDAGGNFSGTSGTTTLAGKYVKMNDSCGAISQAADASGVADMGTSTGTDCTTPGHGGAGNTHASRSGYWWHDQIKQKIRSFLPSNTWNNGQLTVNMNLNQTCNAYWNGSTVNFFKSGGGCGNTGELPDVFLHEFGHGLDQNDSTGTSSESGTGEAYGDTTALTMGHHSCTGPGFLSSNCSGYGDACTACTGVRELDYHKRASNSPWTAAKNASSCPAATCVGPMGKECHCESQPLTQGNWDLAQSLITKYGSGAGWYKLDQLWYLTRNTAGQGFTKVSSTTANGCGSANWLNTFLVANDDDGNLANGTPDASQIQAAYNAHGIGCSTLTSTSTQTGAALATPALSSTSTSTSVSLSWGAISGASSYKVFKNMLGCSYGFIQLASATSGAYTDSQVSTAGTYYYSVQAVGASASSISQFSNCIAVTPSGTTTTFSISGTITDSSSAGISGVTVSTGSASATTSSTGAWTISGLANGSYTVTPSKTGYTFSPANRAVTISGANVTGQNFTGTATTTTYSITGAAGTASATVSYSGAASGSTVADASGNYSISGLVAGTYTLSASKSGCTFSPTSLSVTVGPNATGKNFTATCGGTGATALTKGVAANSSTNSTSANSDYKDFTLAVPSGASNLVINTTSAGDVDLYVKFGATPSLTVYDCRPYTGSGAESCSFATPSVGTYYIRVYGYATGAVSFTVKGDWTTGGTGGTQVERLTNAGFESGNTVWTLSGTASAYGITTTGTYPHTGTAYSYFGNNINSASYTMYQTVSVPSTATAGSVSFWVSIVTSETTTTTAYDTLTAKITDTAGTTLCTLATLSNLNKTAGAGSYVQKSYTLSSTCVAAIKGKSVRLTFSGSTDSSLTTTFRVDDTSMKTD